MIAEMSTRWQGTDAPRGDQYDARWRSLAAAGHNIHGEADLVERLLLESGGTRVLDAGCGTGRVAIELARRGFSVVGVDVDANMLAAARGKAPEVLWIEADLADLADLGDRFDVAFDLIVLAGNVMIFLEPGSEGRVLSALAANLAPGGLLVSGFGIRPDRLPIETYDRLAEASGFERVARWATWDHEAFTDGHYAVSVHRRQTSPRPP
jgi:SAM-dependent methyltransferase